MPTLELLITFLVCLYPFVIYPALIAVWFRRNRGDGTLSDDTESPTVALVICALNERNVIRQKVENSLALDYPAGKLRIVVVSDGSTDGTVDILRPYAGAGVEIIDQPVRRGKVTNLNEILPGRSEEILVLSDANVMYRPDAIRRLTSRFRDRSIGCVSGKVILTESAHLLDAPTAHYYSLEWLLQEAASRIYSMPGADGAMYALRRELFVRCPDDTVIEDFVIPMAVVRQGSRVVFEPAAVGWENGVTSVNEEFRRRVRIAAGAAQALVRGNGWPVNAPPRFWFVFVSHKLLRWMAPVNCLMLLTVALASPSRIASQVIIAGSVVALTMAGATLLTKMTHPVLNGALYFVLGQVAAGYGLLKGMTGRQTVLWAKANR